MSKFNNVRFYSIFTIAALMYFTSGSANAAKFRRLNAGAVCQPTDYWEVDTSTSNDAMRGIEMTGSSGTSRYTVCHIPSDSYFTISEIEILNLHVNMTGGTLSAQVCVIDSCNSNANRICGSTQTISTTGDQYVSFTGDTYLGALWDHPHQHAYVRIWTSTQGNNVNTIYTADE